MADKNIGKITQVIGAVLDLKFSEGYLPEINDAVEITRKDVMAVTRIILPCLDALWMRRWLILAL